MHYVEVWTVMSEQEEQKVGHNSVLRIHSSVSLFARLYTLYGLKMRDEASDFCKGFGHSSLSLKIKLFGNCRTSIHQTLLRRPDAQVT